MVVGKSLRLIPGYKLHSCIWPNIPLQQYRVACHLYGTLKIFFRNTFTRQTTRYHRNDRYITAIKHAIILYFQQFTRIGKQGGVPCLALRLTSPRGIGSIIYYCRIYTHSPCVHPYPFLMQGVSSRVHGEQLHRRCIVRRWYNIIPLVLGRSNPHLRGQ